MPNLNGRVARLENALGNSQPVPIIPSPDVEAAMERGVARAKALVLLSGGREVFGDIQALLVDDTPELLAHDSELLREWRKENPEQYAWTGGGEDPREVIAQRVERRIDELRRKEMEPIL